MLISSASIILRLEEMKMGYLLVDKVCEGIPYQARVIKNRIVVLVNSIKLFDIDAWDYNQKDIELLVSLEFAKLGYSFTGTVINNKSSAINSIAFC